MQSRIKIFKQINGLLSVSANNGAVLHQFAGYIDLFRAFTMDLLHYACERWTTSECQVAFNRPLLHRRVTACQHHRTEQFSISAPFRLIHLWAHSECWYKYSCSLHQISGRTLSADAQKSSYSLIVYAACICRFSTALPLLFVYFAHACAVSVHSSRCLNNGILCARMNGLWSVVSTID